MMTRLRKGPSAVEPVNKRRKLSSAEKSASSKRGNYASTLLFAIAGCVGLLYLIGVGRQFIYVEYHIQTNHSLIYQGGEDIEHRNGRSIGGSAFENEAISVQNFLVKKLNRRSLPLTAYVESSLPEFRRGNHSKLPLRLQPDLTRFTYNRVGSCQTLANDLPVDHFPLKNQADFGSNVGRTMKSLYDVRWEYAKDDCPVDADPFLPWIHDVFPHVDGTRIEFVAHNKRRCRTSWDFLQDLDNLEPQVTLMQPVPVKRLSEEEVRAVAPAQLWGSGGASDAGYDWIEQFQSGNGSRYRLANLEDADSDGRETRFICQFHTLQLQDKKLKRTVLGETLSVYPYNYEHANYRKPKSHTMLTRPQNKQDKHGAHNEQIWNSILHFSCPVPRALQTLIRTGSSVVRDFATIYLDLVPIRTRPRLNREGYFPQSLRQSTFDPQQEWGKSHVLPTISSSGRWASIPICSPPGPKQEDSNVSMNPHKDKDKSKHTLVGCLWASANFATRGSDGPTDDSTLPRLLEWLTFHLYIANLDHVYIYDNSGAYSNTTSLAPVVDLFPSSRVTRIPFSHRVCNNNGPSHPNVGERSSQYAAEASCRLRYGPLTEWMVFFDTDEYLVPQSNWNDLQHWLKEGTISGLIDRKTQILSFFQTRAMPNVEYIEPYVDPASDKCGNSVQDATCLAKRSDSTYLEAYNCDFTSFPKPDWAWRAKKQIYKPQFVLNHYVHYSTVTTRLLEAPDEPSATFVQRRPFERRVDETNEAFMLHTKTTLPLATKDWKQKCHVEDTSKPHGGDKCPVGIPWPLEQQNGTARSDGMKYNCFAHKRVVELTAILKKLLKPLEEKYSSLSK